MNLAEQLLLLAIDEHQDAIYKDSDFDLDRELKAALSKDLFFLHRIGKGGIFPKIIDDRTTNDPLLDEMLTFIKLWRIPAFFPAVRNKVAASLERKRLIEIKHQNAFVANFLHLIDETKKTEIIDNIKHALDEFDISNPRINTLIELFQAANLIEHYFTDNSAAYAKINSFLHKAEASEMDDARSKSEENSRAQKPDSLKMANVPEPEILQDISLMREYLLGKEIIPLEELEEAYPHTKDLDYNGLHHLLSRFRPELYWEVQVNDEYKPIFIISDVYAGQALDLAAWAFRDMPGQTVKPDLINMAFKFPLDIDVHAMIVRVHEQRLSKLIFEPILSGKGGIVIKQAISTEQSGELSAYFDEIKAKIASYANILLDKVKEDGDLTRRAVAIESGYNRLASRNDSNRIAAKLNDTNEKIELQKSEIEAMLGDMKTEIAMISDEIEESGGKVDILLALHPEKFVPLVRKLEKLVQKSDHLNEKITYELASIIPADRFSILSAAEICDILESIKDNELSPSEHDVLESIGEAASLLEIFEDAQDLLKVTKLNDSKLLRSIQDFFTQHPKWKAAFTTLPQMAKYIPFVSSFVAVLDAH
jgi:hypothetical protein